MPRKRISPEERLAKDREKKKAYKLRYPDRVSKQNAKYFQKHYAENKEYHLHLSMIKRVSKQHRYAKWDREFTLFVAEEAIILRQLREKVFGFKWHVDHVIPLNGKLVSGLHVWNNIAVIPAVENIRKSNQYDPIEGDYKECNL